VLLTIWLSNPINETRMRAQWKEIQAVVRLTKTSLPSIEASGGGEFASKAKPAIKVITNQML